MEVPYRDPQTGHITRPIDLSKLDETIKMMEEANAEGTSKKVFGKKMDLTSFYQLREKAIDKEPLFDNPMSRA